VKDQNVFYPKKRLDTKRCVAVFVKRIYKTTPTFSWNIPAIGGFFHPPNGSTKGGGVFENKRKGGVNDEGKERRSKVTQRFTRSRHGKQIS